MRIWPFFKVRPSKTPEDTPDSMLGLGLSPYVGEYLAALDRTSAFGFEAPIRLLVKKDCVDMQAIQPVLLDFFERSPPDSRPMMFDGRTVFILQLHHHVAWRSRGDRAFL